MRWPLRRRKEELDPKLAYDLWAAHYGEPPNALQEIEHENLMEMLPTVAGARVLDLGCGRGRVVGELVEQEPETLLGLDLSLGMLVHWRAPGVSRLAGDLSRLPLRENSFDVVICALVLAHLARLDSALEAISGVLRPGGTLVFSDFHPRAASRGWQRTFTASGSQRELAVRHHAHKLDDYQRPLHEAGWYLEEMREPCWKGVPVLLMMRWRRPVSPIDPGS